MGFITGFFRFWYDFIVGDAWEIAAGIVVVLALGALLLSTGAIAASVVPLLVGACIVLVVAGSIWTEARRRSAS